MTIIYLYHSYYLYGGIERVLIDKMNYLANIYEYNIIMVSYCQFDKKLSFPVSPKIKKYDLQIPIYHQYSYGILKRTAFYRKMRTLFINKMKIIIEENHANILVGTTYEYFMMDV